MWDSATGSFRAWAADEGGKCRVSGTLAYTTYKCWRWMGIRAKEGVGANLMCVVKWDGVWVVRVKWDKTKG